MGSALGAEERHIALGLLDAQGRHGLIPTGHEGGHRNCGQHAGQHDAKDQELAPFDDPQELTELERLRHPSRAVVHRASLGEKAAHPQGR
jgi:hypothetical protein